MHNAVKPPGASSHQPWTVAAQHRGKVCVFFNCPLLDVTPASPKSVGFHFHHSRRTPAAAIRYPASLRSAAKIHQPPDRSPSLLFWSWGSGVPGGVKEAPGGSGVPGVGACVRLPADGPCAVLPRTRLGRLAGVLVEHISHCPTPPPPLNSTSPQERRKGTPKIPAWAGGRRVVVRTAARIPVGDSRSPSTATARPQERHGTRFETLAILVKALKCASGELETDV